VAFSILCSTLIAELKGASTGHVTTPMAFFHPEFTFGALLISGPLYKLHEKFIFFREIHRLLILLTRLACMSFSLTFQAVFPLTFGASEISGMLIELEGIGAAWSGAPAHVLRVLIDKVVQTELVILLK